MLFNVTPEITFCQLNGIIGFDEKLMQVNTKL